MQVKALEAGFFGGSRVRAGQVFDVPEGTKAPWFAPIEEYKQPAAAKKTGKEQKPQALSEMAKDASVAKSQVEVLAEAGKDADIA